MKLLLVGARGLVGRHVLEQALVDAVVAPTRRPLRAHPKLQAPVVDFERLPQGESWWRSDAVVCSLGTTIRTAGSQAAFRRVDHDYPLEVGRLAKASDTPTFVLNSAMGADAASRFFYSRVKGELERDLVALGFRSLVFVRPSLIGGERGETRTAEQIATLVLRAVGPALPRSLRINPASRIARAMLEAALAGCPGQAVIRSSEMT